MEISELLNFVVFPAAIGLFAASVNQTRSLIFWAIPISLLIVLLIVSLVLSSTTSFSDTRQEAIGGLVFFGCPTLAAFAVARRAAFRKRRGLAVVAASLTYVVILFACLVAAGNLGILEP